MKRNAALKVLNLILLVLFLNQALTVILIGHLSHDAFDVLHKGGGTLLILTGILHFALNFNWVKANYFSRRGQSRSDT